jgi:2-polyprenyl-3-methyl-5-hydroxy-6-metoxy-1,4-benzoquinol methylase
MPTVRTHSFAQDYQPTLVDRFGVWLSARQIRRYVTSFDGKTLADVGCGHHAAFTRSVLTEIKHATLVDVSLAADLKQDPKITAIEGALPEALDTIAPGSVDVALLMSVLEHLWEPERTLRKLRELLSPDGTLLVNVPSWRGKEALEFSAFKLGLSPKAEMDDHKTYYDVKDLWPLLVRAGFLPSNIKCFGHKGGLNTFAVCRQESS